MNAISDRLLQRATGLGISLTPVRLRQLTSYFELLRRWNPRVNLTSLPLDALSPIDFDRLLIEPLAIAPYVPDSAAAWFDLGSGGGSPAIPLKVVQPALRLTMVEAKSRKCAFLREALRTVSLIDASVVQARIENLPELTTQACVGLITMRAIRMAAEVVAVCEYLLESGGCLMFLGGSEPPNIVAKALTLSQSIELPTVSSAWLHVHSRA